MVQWFRLHTPNAGDLGLIPDQGTRSHMLQLKISHDTTKILHAATETRCNQKNKTKPQGKKDREKDRAKGK